MSFVLLLTQNTMQHSLLNNNAINLSSLMLKLAIVGGLTGVSLVPTRPVKAAQTVKKPPESNLIAVNLAERDRTLLTLEASSLSQISIAQALPRKTLTPLEKSSVAKVPKEISTVTSPTEENKISTSKKVIIQSNLNTDETKAIPELPTLEVAQQNSETGKSLQQIHTVQPGETISNIANSYGISQQELIEANQIDDANRIAIADELILPLGDSEPQNQPQQVSDTSLTDSNQPIQLLPLIDRQAAALNSDNRITPIRRSSERLRRETTPLPLTSSNLTSEAQFSAKNTPENNRDSFIAKLRAEIIELRTQYQNQTQVRGNTANPAIIATELTNESESKRSTTTYSLNAEEREQTTPRKEAESVSVAPSTAQGYDEIMELAALNRSIPDLPPLSSPEEYLPNGYFKGYIWPAQGTFTSGFGMRWGRMHKGIDIAAPIGTPIMAAASGEVIVAGWNSGGFGNLVKLKHSDGSVTLYAHNNRIYVRQGQTVEQGQQIAEMGSTGFSTGPHLHFEIRPNGNTAVNPIAHLPSK